MESMSAQILDMRRGVAVSSDRKQVCVSVWCAPPWTRTQRRVRGCDA